MTRPLRVLHGAYEIAGQGMMLARALREQGCDARSLSYRVDWDARQSDFVVDLDARRGAAARGLAMLGSFARLAPRFDVFHLHFGTSLLPRLWDVPVLKRLGKKIVFHFHGCEVRNRSHMLETHRLSTCVECDPFCRPRHQRWLLARTAALADRVFYSTLDLGESVPNATPLPLAIEAERWSQAAERAPLPDFDRRDGVHGPVVVGHAPTNRLIKGTRHVVAAVERLRAEFPRLELRLIERQPWAEMPAFLAGCDILVDQLHMGWYGLLAIEGMAEGKAVIAYLRDDFAGRAADLPVVNATPDSLVATLRELVRDPGRRAALGARGRDYVRATHDTRVVGATLLAAYRALYDAPAGDGAVKARFVFDPTAWGIPEARHAVQTLASLLEVRVAFDPPGTPASGEDARVFVGRAESAPADAAAVIAVDGWPEWQARSLARVRVAGEPLPCPPGTAETPDEGTVFPPAWLRAAGFLIAREEEHQDPRRDQWECYSGAYTRLAELQLLQRPMLNHQARALERRLAGHAESRGRTLQRLPRWKGDARFAVALTHDVDDVTLRSWRTAWRLLRQSRGPSSYAFRAGLTGLARAFARSPGSRDPYWTFEDWMGEEERRGFRASYYFAASPSPRHEYDPLYLPDDPLRFEGEAMRVRELMRELARRGHEVGLHGSYLSHRDGAELSRQRARIAAAAGVDPIGTRQHFLRFDVRATWSAQVAAGFRYDSTLGYNEALGFRAGIAAPFRPWDAAGRKPHALWEVPLTAMDGTLFRTLRLDVDDAVARVRRHLDAVEQVGGLAVLLWHPNAADARRFPGWWECWIRTLDDLAARPAWVASAGAIAQWWDERARA